MSYAHEDERFLKRLISQFSSLTRINPSINRPLATIWHDQLILPGTNWADAINAHLQSAEIILLLISADFLSSDYCYVVEMQSALDRHSRDEACVIPVIVRPSFWQETPFAVLQALPTDAKPIVSWNDQDEALLDIVKGVRRVIAERYTP